MLVDIWKKLRGNQVSKESQFYKEFVHKGDLCFDIGANVGVKTQAMLDAGARVIAVDPQPVCAAMLRKRFRRKDVTIVEKALGAQEGTAKMHVCTDMPSLSTLSDEWIRTTREHGRFAKHDWDSEVTVQVTTMDKLVEQYGTPLFAKIDVEGYEYDVIKGLNKPIKYISLEFAYEYLESIFLSLEHLAGLGQIQVNYAKGKAPQFASKTWLSVEELKEEMMSLEKELSSWGDVYVMFIE